MENNMDDIQAPRPSGVTFEPLGAPIPVPPFQPAQRALPPDDPFSRITGIPSPAFNQIASGAQPHAVPASAPAPKPPQTTPSFVSPSPSADRISYADAKIQEVEITSIVPNPYQPRKVFDPQALRELADSIAEHGVIQPLVVTRTPSGYEIVVGERRFRASQLAGLSRVPVIVKNQLEDITKLEVALIENIQRQELNPIEEAQAYDRLMKTFKLTQEQVAKKVGKARPSVANTIRLLNLPAEIQRGLVEGKISEGHARAILGLVDREKMLAMYQQVLDSGWNVRQVELKVREISERRRVDAAAPDPKLMALEGELRTKLGTQVKIQRQGRGGKITIEFFSEDELADIVGRMAEHPSDAPDAGYIAV